MPLMTCWTEFAQAAAGSLVTDIWQGLVLAAGVGLCLQWLPRTTARMRFAVWAAVFALIGILPLLHSFSTATHRSTTSAFVHADTRWSLGIAAVWALCSLVRAGQLLHGAIRLRAVHRSAKPVEDAPELRSGFRRVMLCTSSEVDRPSVIGFFSPRILIPDWLLKKLTPEEMDQVVLHEMGHLNRGDDWLNLLQKIGLVLFPLNPALVWVERRLCLEREIACDDDVLNRTGAPKSYATCLTRLAEHRLERRSLALTLGAWGRKSELAQRVYSILKRGPGMSPLQARIVMSALLLSLLGGAAGLSRCRQLVAFTAPQPDAPSWTAEVATANDMKAAMRPVVFHPKQSPLHAELLKATVPAPKAAKPVVRKKVRPQQPQMLKARITEPRAQQHWIVMTSWESDAPTLAITTTRSERAEFTTYALPTPAGWLVIQL
ncbi:M56 family metallopeptidase [Silvibacterium acidisoli]|uniref:M56 family metallopeptidase n=1 Tax=Acidobacteriaceae bacterium ZG23-2 TaxID=2883246 RepID=UPI00406BE9ED